MLKVMKEKTPLFLLTCLITIGAIVNLIRLYWNIPVCIGSFTLPGWTGATAYLVLGLLAAWSFRALFSDSRAYSLPPEKEEEQLPPSA